MTHRNIYMTDELQAIYDQTVEFVSNEVKPNGDRWEQEGKVPREVLGRMGELGMLSLRVPEEHGGLGMGMLASATFSEALGSSTFAGFEVTVLVHTDMAGPHLVNSGTPEQLERYMPDVLAGELILSIGVSEPDAGSDVAGIRTRAVKDGDGWRINGTKTFITNAVYGNLTIVAARTDLENKYGISMFLVPAGTEGFTVAKKLDKHGWRCSDTAELLLDDVWVGDDQLLGTPHQGFYETMKNFQNERMVLVGMGVGAAQAAIDLTNEYTQNRKAFGATLYDLGAIRQRMAMNQAKVDAVRASMYHAAWLGDQGLDNVKEMSGAKAWGCEVVNQVMYDCVQFHGGIGYMRESAIERMYRDARILPIGGGATEVMLEEVAKRSMVGVMYPAPPPRLRSLLFAPAVRQDLLPKLPRSGADGVVIDCEDATPISQKAAGRLNAVELAPTIMGQGSAVFTRINPPGTPWFGDDVSFGLNEDLDGVVVPMVETVEGLDRCGRALAEAGFGHLGIIAGLETARGVADAPALLAHPQVIGAYFGAEDYIVDLGGVRTSSNTEVLYARSAVALAGRLARKPVIDQIVANFRDFDRFSHEAFEARAMGFKGKLCIHPDQVALANAGFTPTEAEVERAERMLAAYDIGVASGVAAIDFEGSMVDEPLAEQARQILAAAGIDPRHGP